MGAAVLLNFIRLLLIALEVAILGRVLLSYVEPRGGSTVAQFVIMVTEPVLAPVRRVLPPAGMLDFSPLIVLLVLGAVLRSLP